MFNATQRSSFSAFFNAHKALSLVLAAGALSSALPTPAMAGDAEITLKAGAAITADTLFGIVDLGGTALMGVEPDEIDVAVATAGATASGGLVVGSSVVTLEGLTFEGLSPEDVAFGRDGLAHLAVEAGFIHLEGIKVHGTNGVDATGAPSYASFTGSLVLMPVGGTLHETRDPASGEGRVGLGLDFIVTDILHKGGATFRATNVTLKRGVIGASAPLITDLPALVQAGTGTTEGDMGCSSNNICACGGADSCNTLLAGCFTPGIDGSWDCVSYNDQGQCVLGMCDVN